MKFRDKRKELEKILNKVTVTKEKHYIFSYI